MLGIEKKHQEAVLTLLGGLKNGEPGVQEHYFHSLRVGHLAQQIAACTFHDEKALLLAGTLHDVGKTHIPISVLTKTSAWTEADATTMEAHVPLGYEMLRGIFDFSAEILLWHHKFQRNGYPKILPPPLHEYSDATKVLIVEHGRLLAIADVYDALHRSNDKFGGALTGTKIRELMFELNPDRTTLVSHLYNAGVFVV
jgi:putative nucleotidyltransferase with HDIG domain